MTSESDPFHPLRPLPPLTVDDIVAASGCLHRRYLDCHGDPESRRADPVDDREEDAFKRHCIAWLPDVREPAWDGGENGRLDTLKLLAAGHAWIFRGVLKRDDLEGRPDLLQRVDGRSALGPFSYVPAKVKHRTGRPGTADLRELRLHALLLEPALGRLPTQGWVYGSDGSATELDLRTAWGSFTTLIDDLRRIGRGELLTEGYRCS